tara:strand:+ start:254 stop:448 length:195 start_codon:yes stop_codon:yes gene_type:complete
MKPMWFLFPPETHALWVTYCYTLVDGGMGVVISVEDTKRPATKHPIADARLEWNKAINAGYTRK